MNTNMLISCCVCTDDCNQKYYDEVDDVYYCSKHSGPLAWTEPVDDTESVW